MLKKQLNLKTIFLFSLLITSYGCDSSGDSNGYTQAGNSQVFEEIIAKIDKGSNKQRCEALLEIYPMGKDVIPYLIERIDEPRREFFGLKNSNITISIKGESQINHKPLGILYAYMVDFILLKNDLTTITCSDNQLEILPVGNLNYISPYGMLGRVEDRANKKVKGYKFSTLDFENLPPLDMREVKTSYENWWFYNKRYDLDRLRSDYIRSSSTPLGSSLYYWY